MMTRLMRRAFGLAVFSAIAMAKLCAADYDCDGAPRREENIAPSIPVRIQPPPFQTANPEMRVERVRVGTGADLLTVLRNDVPLLAILRDDLGAPDPEAAQLRYVWVLNSARPTFLQRATSALPFFYWRTPSWKRAKSAPPAIFDLSNPRRSVYRDTGALMMQFSALDPSGWMVRASSRSYRGNSQDYRRAQVLESLAALTDLEQQPEFARPINDPELRVVQARLKLATQTFGGLVSERRLPEAYFNQREREQEARGHNWEMLRQEAESNGLYFQSLGLPGQATHARLPATA